MGLPAQIPAVVRAERARNRWRINQPAEGRRAVEPEIDALAEVQLGHGRLGIADHGAGGRLGPKPGRYHQPAAGQGGRRLAAGVQLKAA